MPKYPRMVILTTALLMLPVAAQAQSEGGLAERRAMAAYSKDVWPSLEKQIQDAAGFPVAVSLDADSLAIKGYADSYALDDYLRKPIIDPVIKALSAITSDAMGKDALRTKLKSVVISYDEATAPVSNYEDGITFADGTLKVNWKPYTNVDDVDARVAALTKVLENNL